MYFGRAGFGIFLMVFHLVVAGAFLVFIYNISKSLKKIADNSDKTILPAIEGTHSQNFE